MPKTQCKNDDYREKDDAKFVCKRCERTAKKEDKLCKPKKIKDRKKSADQMSLIMFKKPSS